MRVLGVLGVNARLGSKQTKRTFALKELLKLRVPQSPLMSQAVAISTLTSRSTIYKACPTNLSNHTTSNTTQSLNHDTIAAGVDDEWSGDDPVEDDGAEEEEVGGAAEGRNKSVGREDVGVQEHEAESHEEKGPHSDHVTGSQSAK
uniref:Prothymosin alpha-like n=1 Tax=Steinernema glaseri TaxID=37863 RepID=A0A1I7YM54_9BILA